jgi:hypothetical protein
MEALIASLGLILATTAAMLALVLASVRWGADSRPPLADDHRR